MEAAVLRLDGSSNARELVDEIAAVVESAAAAVGQVTEATLSDRIEGAVRAMSVTLGALVSQLPEGPEECDRLLQTWRQVSEQSQTARQMLQDAEALDEYARRFDLLPWSAAIEEVPQNMSAEEAQQVILLVRAALSDVLAALNDVSRDEIEELADVALTVARMAISMAQRVSRQMRMSVDRESEQGVIIEDITEPPAAASAATTPGDGVASGGGGGGGGEQQRGSAAVAAAPRSSRLRPPTERLLWRPLWHQARDWVAAPTFPRVKAHLQAAPVWLWLSLVVFWPVGLVVGLALLWLLAWLVPLVVFADALFQWVYATRHEEIDDCIDGAAQVVRLWYLTLRLAVRRASRFGRSQLRRALGGRPVREALAEWMANPGASAAGAARVASQVSSALWRALSGAAATARAGGMPPAMRSARAQVRMWWRHLAAL